MNNPLNDSIPPNVRKIAYAAYALIGVALGATQVGFSAAEAGQPVWLVVAMAVFGFIGGAFGVTAASNIQSQISTPTIVINGSTSPETVADAVAKMRDNEHNLRDL